jgi:hypothetical protein
LNNTQPEELFDDLEAEFTLEKPKTKKPSQQAFGAGGGAGGQAGLKAVPGLGGGKGAADEVCMKSLWMTCAGFASLC